MNRLSMLPRARRLNAAGFSVLLFDFQAHGESPGRHITLGKLEGQDAASAVQFVRARAPAERIGVIGVSLGAAAALLAPQALDVQALVLESAYQDIDIASYHWLEQLPGFSATPLLAALFERLFLPMLGLSASELRPIDRIAFAQAPLLVASGMEDRLAPLAEARSLFDRAPEPKLFLAVPGVGHDDFEQYASDRYWENVLPFLLGYLRPPLDVGDLARRPTEMSCLPSLLTPTCAGQRRS